MVFTRIRTPQCKGFANPMADYQCTSKKVIAFFRGIIMSVNYFFISGEDPRELIWTKCLSKVNPILFLQISQQSVFVLAIKYCFSQELIHSKLWSILVDIILLVTFCIFIWSLFNSPLLIAKTARTVTGCDNLMKSSFTENRIHRSI